MFEGEPMRRYNPLADKPKLYWIHILTAYGVLIFLVGFLGTNITPIIDVDTHWFKSLGTIIPSIDGRALQYAYPDHARFTLVLAWVLLPLVGVTSGVMHGLSNFRPNIRGNKGLFFLMAAPLFAVVLTFSVMNWSHASDRIGSVGFVIKVWNSGPFGFGLMSALMLWAVAMSCAMGIAAIFFMFKRHKSHD